MSEHRFALENEISAASRMDSTINVSSDSNRGNGNSVVWSNKENDGRGNKGGFGNRSNSSMNASECQFKFISLDFISIAIAICRS